MRLTVGKGIQIPLVELAARKETFVTEQIEEWKSGMFDKYGKAEGASQKKYLMTKLLVNEASNNPELCNTIVKTGSLSFLMQPPFNQDFNAEDWINTFGKEELVSMVYDIKNNKILRY